MTHTVPVAAIARRSYGLRLLACGVALLCAGLQAATLLDLQVERQRTSITLSSNHTPFTQPGDVITISGRLGGIPDAAGALPVSIVVRHPDGFVFSGQITTSASGIYQHPITVRQTGYVRVEVRAFENLLDFRPSRSEMIIPVRPLGGMAIVVAGGDQDPGSFPDLDYLSDTALKALRRSGFLDEACGESCAGNRLWYLHPDITHDLDGDAQPDVDRAPTLANLQHGIQVWAKALMATRDASGELSAEALQSTPLTVYLVGHNDQDGFRLNAGEVLTPAMLDAYLDDLDAAVAGQLTAAGVTPPAGVAVNVIIEAASSGDFIAPIAQPGRIILTSTEPGGVSYIASGGSVSFSAYFFSRIAGGHYILPAFAYTQLNILSNQQTAGQRPQLEATGNGHPNEIGDEIVASSIPLDERPVGSARPRLLNALGQITLRNIPAALLWVYVDDPEDDVAAVEVMVQPPPGSYEETRVIALTESTTSPDRWEGVFDRFAGQGDYTVTYTARDITGRVARPLAKLVQVQDAVAPLDVTDLRHVQALHNTIMLAWSPSESTDTQGYRIYVTPPGGIETLAADAGNVSRYLVSGVPWGTTPGTFRFRVTAYDRVPLESTGVTLHFERTDGQSRFAHAGPDVSAREGDLVTLDGSRSAGVGQSLTYQWTQLEGCASVTLSNSSSATPSFTAPALGMSCTYVFRLTVFDGSGSSTDTVAVDVVHVDPYQPQCADLSATTREDVALELPLACSAGGLLVGLEVGRVRTVAGSGVGGWGGDGGLATAALLNLPNGVSVDRSGNLYVAESGGHRVRRVSLATGVITTVAGSGVAGFSGDGGPALEAQLNDPRYAIADAAGHVFIADISNSRIRRVDAQTGIITTVAGGGPAGAAEGVAATSATLLALGGMAFDAKGDLFLVETGHNRIRRVARGADGLVTGAADEDIITVAGTGGQGYSGDDGPATDAQFSAPQDLAFDLQDNLFVADSQNHRIRRVAAGSDGAIGGAADEIITTVAGGGPAAGDGVPATTIALNLPRGITVDRAGHVYISEAGALRIRRVEHGTGLMSTVLGGSALGEDIPAATARTFNPRGLAIGEGGTLFVAELGAHRVRAVQVRPPALTFDVIDPPANGQATLLEAGALIYRPYPNFAGEDQLTFRVINGAGQSSEPATVRITIAAVDDPPFAHAGGNQVASVGSVVHLDGSGSHDVEGVPLTYSWAFVSRPSGSGGSLQAADTAHPTFTPTAAGVYVIELTVADASGEVATDSVTITATPVPDLVVSTLSAVFDGETFDIQLVAANRGHGHAGTGVEVRLLQSSDQILDTGDRSLLSSTGQGPCVVAVPPLPAGATSGPLAVSCRPGGSETGEFAIAEIDSPGRVQESNETNNATAARVDGPDDDGDGIFDVIDPRPLEYSNNFSDVFSGGTTFGIIRERGTQLLTLSKAATGIRISAGLSGGAVPATLSFCGGGASLSFTPGDVVVVRCGSVIVDVVSGAVESTFFAADGAVATATLVQGNGVTFEPETAALVAGSGNAAPIVVISSGLELQIAPGMAEALVKQVVLDVKPGASPNSINLGSEGTVPAAILSQADFAAPTEIDADSLSLSVAAVNRVGKVGRLQCGSEDVNADGRPDLVCHFVTADLDLQPGDSLAVLLGRTRSGRQIRGEDMVRAVREED